MKINFGSVYLENTSFFGCSTGGGQGGEGGGGMCLAFMTYTRLVGDHFKSCSSPTTGGGLSAVWSSYYLSSCSFVDCAADEDGGGLYDPGNVWRILDSYTEVTWTSTRIRIRDSASRGALRILMEERSAFLNAPT